MLAKILLMADVPPCHIDHCIPGTTSKTGRQRTRMSEPVLHVHDNH